MIATQNKKFSKVLVIKSGQTVPNRYLQYNYKVINPYTVALHGESGVLRKFGMLPTYCKGARKVMIDALLRWANESE